jgi:hypothetical protein
MTIKLKSLAADLKKKAEGEWRDIPDLPGVRVNVRALNYMPYRTDRDAMNLRHGKQYPDGRVPDDVMAREFGSIVAEHLLLDWEGFDVPYSADVALETLTDEAFSSTLTMYIVAAAARVGEARVEFEDRAVKN